jgi:hypothetical protein
MPAPRPVSVLLLALLCAAAPVAATGQATSPATPAVAPPSLEPFRPLTGEWIGEGSGAPGEATGRFTFSFDLNERVLVRRDLAEFPPAGGRPGFRHEDLLVLWPVEDGARATYWDDEGHHIDYRCTASARAWTCQTQGTTPGFRLEYRMTAPGSLTITFSISPGGTVDGFKPYLTGSARRAVPAVGVPKSGGG